MLKNKFRNFNRKIYIIYWLIVSFILTLLIVIIDILVIKHQLRDYYLSTFGYTEYLMQNNYSLEAYQRLIEVSSSIYIYEKVEKGNFFAAEIWDCENCESNRFPIWQTNASSIAENAKNNSANINNFLKKISSIFVYNDWLIIKISFPIYSYKIVHDKVFKQKKYTLKFYKKAIDYKIFKDRTSFFEVFTILNVLVFALLFFIIIIPINILKRKVAINTARKIESSTLENIKNMIEHELVNQENVLKFPVNLNDSIAAALHHNNVAQVILRKVRIENVNPLEVLDEAWKNIGNTKIKLVCNIDIISKAKFDRSKLFIAFNTILKNAVHDSVNAQNIEVNITQNWFNKVKKVIAIEITNDGKPIPRPIRKKIFSGFSNKSDGHGIALKNLREILLKNGSFLKLLAKNKTSFYFLLKASDEKLYIHKSITLKNEISEEVLRVKAIDNEEKPLVIIIEDNEFIWNGWQQKMKDAFILFFRNPDEFFCHIDEERIHGNHFLSKISAIISDFDFGNGVNFINSNLIGGIENEDEEYKGKIILCTGFNERIQRGIPHHMKDKIDLFFQKRPMSYLEIIEMLETKRFS